jgi:hypothetical protein
MNQTCPNCGEYLCLETPMRFYDTGVPTLFCEVCCLWFTPLSFGEAQPVAASAGALFIRPPGWIA